MATVTKTRSARKDAYQIITDRILDLLEKGTVPWHRPWGGQAAIPRSAATKKVYRGINLFLLHCMQYEQPLWLTYRQADAAGAHVRKGEKGTPIVFWKWIEKQDENGDEKRFPLLRYYTVFNVEQIDDLPDKFYTADVETFDHDPIESAQAIVDGCPAFEVEHGGFKACYIPSADKIRIPNANRFESRQEYYSALFHELVHWTAHPSRLNRTDSDHQFGSSTYAFEELIAEMGANMLCGHAGIFHHVVDNSAAYIAGWLRTLKDDPKMVVQAAAKAQKAVDFILQTTFEEVAR